MTTEAISPARTIGLDDKWLYKAAGIFAWALAVLFVVDLVLYVIAGKLPTTGAEWLPYINKHRGVWWTIIGVTLVSDLIFLILSVALYAALRKVNGALMLIATVWASLALVLDEAVSNTSLGSLVTLAGRYATGTAAQRAADVAAAGYPASIWSSKLDSIYLAVIPAIALVLIGLVMRHSTFGKRTAYLGIAAGVFGALTISGWAPSVLLNTVLEAIWLVLVGRCLYFRYAAAAAAAPAVAVEIPEETVSV